MKRLKKTLKIIGIVLFALIFILIITISPITKYLIEKYDKELTGREIRMEGCFVNPFTGVVRFENIKISEGNSNSIFFKAENVTANFAMIKLLSTTYEISSLTFDRPNALIIKNKNEFNFIDLIRKFSSDDLIEESREEVHFNLLNIEILDGQFAYLEVEKPVKFSIKNVNIDSKGLRWDNDTISANFSFLSGNERGTVEGKTNINMHNLNYNFEALIDSFDLEILNLYLKDLTNYGELAAMLDADVKSSGNFLSSDSITATGRLAIKDFHFGKNKNEDFASFKEIELTAKMLNPKEFIYDFDSIIIKEPFVKYELYDELDNIQTMFGKEGSNVAAVNSDPYKFNLVIEVVKLVEQLTRNVLRSNYKLDRFAIYNGDFQFDDYTIGEKFSIAASPLNLVADSIDKRNERINVNVNSGIAPFGHFNVFLSIDPRDSSYFDMNYQITEVPLAMFNPYATYYTSFPFYRGSSEAIGNWKVRAGQISSLNHLVIIDPSVKKRKKNKDSSWIPIPLILAFVRERANVIDYEIPIQGNLNDPKFKLGDVVSDLLKNILIKPATLPYSMEVKNIEKKLEKSLRLSWAHTASELSHSQQKAIHKMTSFLKENPNAKIVIRPNNFTIKEKEFILLFEAKKRYYLAKNKISPKLFSKKDSIKVVAMSIKDKGFLVYLDQHVHTKLLFTVHHKSAILINQAYINSAFARLNVYRKASFLALFKEEGVDKQVTFDSGKNVIPYNGYSFYSINYKGDFPEYLTEAFKKMDALNEMNPREKYHENGN